MNCRITLLVIGCAVGSAACHSGSTSGAEPAAITVAVSPTSATVSPGGTAQFAATVYGTADVRVSWSVQEVGGGTVDGAGLYTAPATVGTYHVVAEAVANPSARASATVSVATAAPTGKWVTGYYTHWQRSLYPVSKIDWSALTHINVANVGPNADGTLWNPMPDGANTNEWACVIVDAAHANGTKAILMVGGAGTQPDFAAMAGNATTRAKFVTALVNWALKPRAQGGCGFDGIDIDWEPLLLWNGDGPLVAQLAKDLRAAWPGITLTFAAGWADADPWFSTVASLFDQINLMTYAISGTWGGWVSWHHAALFGDGPDHPSSISAAVKWMRDAGVPAAKLGIGIGLYATVWSGGSPPVTGPLQPISSGVFCDRENDNLYTYAYIMQNYYTDAAYRWDDVAKMGSLTYPSGYGAAKATWVSYENEASIRAKGDWVKANGVGGTIVWTLADGCTNSTTGVNPPLTWIKQAFLQ